VAFLGTNGISADHGFSTPDTSEAAVKRTIVRCARQTVVLADSSKLGLDTTVRFAAPAEVDALVTDEDAEAEDLEALRAEGMEVMCA
jgi:DeoR family transcriptional regulator, fructose operon transcriptional repressor